MNIFRPLGGSHAVGSSSQLIDRYQVKSSIQKITMRQDLEELLFDQQEKSDSVFLLDEQLFDLVRYTIEGTVYEDLSLEQLTTLIHNKVQEIKKKSKITGKLLMYDIGNIFVNGNPFDFLLGQQGSLKRDVFLIFVKPSLALSLPHFDSHKERPRLYPSSYFTLQFITQQLNIASFAILSIYEYSSKLVLVRDGFYHTINTLDRGINNLKQILISNNIISYLDKDDTAIASNSLAAGLFEESLDFFMDTLFDRVHDHHQGITNLVVSYPQLKNSFFYQRLVQSFSKTIGGYLLPNSLAQQLDDYGRERNNSELDVLSYLNIGNNKELI